jgi:hypothetical protein
MASPLPRGINVISYNLWLIPFSGAWNFGRIDRCRDRVKFETAKLAREAPSDLQIVALQEARAFRAGLACPVLWLIHKFEGLLPRRRRAADVALREEFDQRALRTVALGPRRAARHL